MTSPTTIDAYLAPLPPDQKAALEDLRQTLRRLLPDATEVISYAMPGFRTTHMIAGFAAFKAHCGFYPHSGSVLPQISDEITALGFKHSKSGVTFTPDAPLPNSLIAHIIELRLAEIAA